MYRIKVVIKMTINYEHASPTYYSLRTVEKLKSLIFMPGKIRCDLMVISSFPQASVSFPKDSNHPSFIGKQYGGCLQ
ncbi:hypothetical protein ABIE66_001206 [Peribacillus sp. B2I2]|uniref:hypothetical protein n=1 Tax=Peribacillus sp. B2I2 TaxID=3156468 RepID=UPI003519110D